MARGDFPFNRLEPNLQPIVARPSCTGRSQRSVERSQARRPDMQIRETIDKPSIASTESPPEDVIVLVDSAGVALGVQRAFSAKVRAVRPGGVSIASRWVEIPLVGGNGQISGVLCQSMPTSDVRGALVSRGPGEAGAIEDVAQLVVHDINNLFAVIASGMRLLECQSDAAYRKAIISKIQ